MLDQMMMWMGYVITGTIGLVISYWAGLFLYQLFVAMFAIGPSWKQKHQEHLAKQERLKAEGTTQSSPPVTLDLDAVLEHRQAMAEESAS